MAITKIQSGAIPADAIDTTHIGDVGADKITGQVVSSQISDLSVTHAKLHTDMDLSSKTVKLSSFDINADYNIVERYKADGSTRLGYLLFRDDGPNYLEFNDTGANQDFRFASNNSSIVTIKANGNVGIGTSSPSETLDVSGNIRALGPNSRVMFGPDGFEAGIKYATDATLQIASRTGEAGDSP